MRNETKLWGFTKLIQKNYWLNQVKSSHEFKGNGHIVSNFCQMKMGHGFTKEGHHHACFVDFTKIFNIDHLDLPFLQYSAYTYTLS